MGPAATRSGGRGSGAEDDLDVGAAPVAQDEVREHLRAGGRGQGARYALLVTQPKARSTRQHETHATCWAHDCTRAPVEAHTAASGQCKSLRRAAQDELLMAPELQTASDWCGFAIGVTRAA